MLGNGLSTTLKCLVPEQEYTGVDIVKSITYQENVGLHQLKDY